MLGISLYGNGGINLLEDETLFKFQLTQNYYDPISKGIWA